MKKLVREYKFLDHKCKDHLFRLHEIYGACCLCIIGESIQKANEQIAECKEELEEAKTIRKNRQGEISCCSCLYLEFLKPENIYCTFHNITPIAASPDDSTHTIDCCLMPGEKPEHLIPPILLCSLCHLAHL